MWSGQCSSSLSWMELREMLSQSLFNVCFGWGERGRGASNVHTGCSSQVCTEDGTRPRSPLARAAETCSSSEPWNRAEDDDTAPAVSRFQPRRTPGVQLETLSPYSPKDLFLLFFVTDTVRTICSNTNKKAAEKNQLGNKYKDGRFVQVFWSSDLHVVGVSGKSPRLLETKSHFFCAPASQSYDHRQVPIYIMERPPQWTWGRCSEWE